MRFNLRSYAGVTMVGFACVAVVASARAQQPVPSRDRVVTSGPIYADARTPIQSLPYTISQSGSYFLVSNLTGVPGMNGITVDCDYVTIDLNGFALLGVPGSNKGIEVVDDRCGIDVHNGTVAEWGDDGIDAFLAEASTFRDLRLCRNGGEGLAAGRGVVRDCMAFGNVDDGIRINAGTISGCTSIKNGVDGESLADGFRINDSCVVTRCQALENFGDGFSVNQDSFLFQNVSNENAGSGINVTGGDNHVDRNFMEDNGAGMSASDNALSLFTRNVLRGDQQVPQAIGPGSKWGHFVMLPASPPDDLKMIPDTERPWINFVMGPSGP